MKKIGEEWCGFDINALTLREILEQLGFLEGSEPGHFIIENLKLLDAYPRTLIDDGMGYGVKEQYITEANPQIYYGGNSLKENVFNLFRDEYRQSN